MAGMADFYLRWGDKLNQGIGQVAGAGNELLAADQRNQAAQNELAQFVERRAAARRSERQTALQEMEAQRKREAEDKEQARKDADYQRNLDFMKWVSERQGQGLDRDTAIREALGKGVLQPKDYLEITKPKEPKVGDIDPALMAKFQTEFLPQISPMLQKMKSDPAAATDIAYLGATSGLAGFKPYEDFVNNLRGMRPESQSSQQRYEAGRSDAVFNQEKAIREKWEAQTKDFRDVRDSFGRIKVSAKDPSAAGDLSLIFNYMKMLDPGSTVREGEFATAAASGSLGDRWVAAGKKLLTGERLDPSQRADFLDRATSLYKQQESQARKAGDEARKLAKLYDLKPDRVVLDQGLFEPDTVLSPASAAGQVQEWIRDPATGKLRRK